MNLRLVEKVYDKEGLEGLSAAADAVGRLNGLRPTALPPSSSENGTGTEPTKDPSDEIIDAEVVEDEAPDGNPP